MHEIVNHVVECTPPATIVNLSVEHVWREAPLRNRRAGMRRLWCERRPPAYARFADAAPLFENPSHAIEPRQQFSYTTGKNATDSALIIDAMDLLHARSLGGFCIVSSDSDYTRLAARIRESGASVYGFGERKTPQPFVAACDKFVYTDVLRPPDVVPSTGQSHEPALEPLLRASIAAAARDSGWSALAVVGSLLNKKDPSFDPRNFGFPKLGELVRAQRYVEVKETSSGDGSMLHVRLCEA